MLIWKEKATWQTLFGADTRVFVAANEFLMEMA